MDQLTQLVQDFHTCVDNRNTNSHIPLMRSEPSLAEINIHLRARAEDKNIIDQAAGIIGSNRSQFMLASALKEAKNILLDQSTIHADAKAFNAIMKWMDDKPSAETKKGMKRLLQAKPLW